MSISSARNRIIGLDLVKCLCTFFVICVHMPYRYKQYIDPMTRIAVPIFLMITGYFYPALHQNKKVTGQIVKIAKLLLVSNLLYFFWNLLMVPLNGQSIELYLQNMCTLSFWVRFLLTGGNAFSDHLWYLGALLYVLIFIRLTDKLFPRKKLYPLIPVLYGLNLLLGNYSTLIFGIRIPLEYSRNFLMTGLPFFLLGDWLSNKSPRIHNNILLTTVLLGSVASCMEQRFLIHMCSDFNADYYISTPFTACALFLLALNISPSLEIGPFPFLAKIGRQSSTTLYILHPIAGFFIGALLAFTGPFAESLTSLFASYAPIFIYIICTSLFAVFPSKRAKHSPRYLRK